MLRKITAAAAAAILSVSAVNVADDISVVIDGNEIGFDVPPQIIEDRTLVPLRAIFEALGAEVEWNGETQTVTAKKGDTEISMTIGNAAMRVNSKEITLDVPPQIIEDRTLVPARAVAEGFGAEVEWNAETRTVVINTDVTAVSEEPVLQPTASPAADMPIKYNDLLERKVDYMSNFKLTNVSKNSDGNYDIEFVLYTYLEGRGTVSVSFRCLDDSGKVVDTFSGIYTGTDYTLSEQHDKATVSGKTSVIELIPAGEK